MKIETFALERWMTTYETKVAYDIAESGICPMTTADLLGIMPAEERERTLADLLNLPLGYSEAPGSLDLRSLLAATYENTGPEHILVTTGAIEANFLLLNVLLEPGDHVVAVEPAYQQLGAVARAIGCEVTPWRLRPETGFRYDLEELEGLITSRTRLIVVNTPHNPTGAMLSDAELGRIYDLAVARGARLLSDEAYRWLEIPGGERLAAPIRNRGDAGISVGTLSKPFGLPGLRIGWMAAPADLVAACWAMRDYVSLSPGKLNDALAVLALRHRDRLVERTQSIVTQNLATAEAWFAAHADMVAWTPPRGGLLALLHYALDIPSLELANRLAEEYSVMLAPGSAFGLEHTLRIGIGQAPLIFATGLERTAACFADLRAAGVDLRPGADLAAAAPALVAGTSS
ncbi:MAG: aminotransferase class I/II-fold pyridoxal phosphate-dependent enzyme [Chloroflexota bacterium]|nr:aminotransferase class I/II-fold pyridoxal phosphate-dependent enzyme [Chloroflexota bacterium]